MQCFMYLRAGSVHDNHYAHPLDLVVFLDMNTGRVLETIMQPSPPFIPQLNTNYLAPLVHKERGFRTGDCSLHVYACKHIFIYKVGIVVLCPSLRWVLWCTSCLQ